MIDAKATQTSSTTVDEAQNATERVMNYLMTERELQDNVIDLCKVLGLLVYHTYDSRRSEPGYPDLTIVGKHSVLFVELKRQGGELSNEQKAWKSAIERAASRPSHSYHAAIEYRLWRPHDWRSGEVEETLRRIA